jgi:Putative serine esterase (DUF676)
MSSEAQTRPPITSSVTNRFVVTLVHGTWARGAKWIQDNSPFREQLQKELTNCGATSVIFHPFYWCATNNHSDRRKESVRLHKQLLDQLSGEPEDAHHFIIAHSHGGNVALRAVGHSPTLKKKVTGIIAIATPFLVFAQTNFSLALLRPALLNACKTIGGWALVPFATLVQHVRLSFTVIVLGALSYYWYIHHSPRWMKLWMSPSYISRTPFRVFAVLALLFFVLLCVVDGWDSARATETEAFKRRSCRIIHRYRYVELRSEGTDVPAFALSSLADEAYGVLTGAWWMHRVVTWGARLAVAGAIVLSGLLAGAAFYEMEQLRAYQYASPSWKVWLLSHAAGLGVFMPVLLSVFLTYELVKLFLEISGRSSPGLGFGNSEDNLICDVRAVRNPLLAVPIANKRYSTWQLIRHAKGVLFHSRIYLHPPAIRDMAEWMSARAAEGSRSYRDITPKTHANLPPAPD